MEGIINRGNACKEARLYCLASVSAYIGAGAYVCELEKTKDNILFIDIGTNGEVVFSNKGKLLCCFCAAGPVLEGMITWSLEHLKDTKDYFLNV